MNGRFAGVLGPLAVAVPQLLLAQTPTLSPVSQAAPQAPPAAAAPAPVPQEPLVTKDPESSTGKTYRIQVKRKDATTLIRALGTLAGVKVKVVSYFPGSVTMDLQHVTFEQGLDAICQSVGIAFKKLEDGSYAVGPESDLIVDAAGPNDTTVVDITYRCRHLNADSVANVISKAFPDLKTITGPLFLSPTIEAGNSISADSSKALSATDQSFKTHDILISGPANLVKRALVLAKKFDRPRRQVRINARLTEISGSLESLLGIAWTFSNVALQEIPDPTITNPTNSVQGLKFGTFAHSAASVGAAVRAQETKGKAKTLASPTISLVDGERSFILIGERRLFPKQTGTNSQGLPIFDVAEVRTGVYLQVAVQLGLDNDMTLTVYPQVSSVTSTVAINNSLYPIIATREAQTTVRLRSGEMLAIGGLVSEQDTNTVTRIPFLGYIPLIGELFTQRNKTKNNNELLLLITPELIPQEGEGGEVSVEP